MQLAMRTGQYRLMNTSEVLEGQMVAHNRFTGEYLFVEEAATSDKIAGYVSYFRLLNGFEKYNYMTVAQIMQHAQRYSQAFRSGKGKWTDDPHSMSLKTVLKLLLSKWGILSIEMQAALTSDSAIVSPDGSLSYDGNGEVSEVEGEEPQAAPKTQTSRVKDDLKGRRAKAKAEAAPVIAAEQEVEEAAPLGGELLTLEEARRVNGIFDSAGLPEEAWEEITSELGYVEASAADIRRTDLARCLAVIARRADEHSAREG